MTSDSTPSPTVSLAGIALIRRAIDQLGPDAELMSRADRFALHRAAADSAARLAGVLAEMPDRGPLGDLIALAQRVSSPAYADECVRFVARLREFAATPTEEKADGTP